MERSEVVSSCLIIAQFVLLVGQLAFSRRIRALRDEAESAARAAIRAADRAEKARDRSMQLAAVPRRPETCPACQSTRAQADRPAALACTNTFHRGEPGRIIWGAENAETHPVGGANR